MGVFALPLKKVNKRRRVTWEGMMSSIGSGGGSGRIYLPCCWPGLTRITGLCLNTRYSQTARVRSSPLATLGFPERHLLRRTVFLRTYDIGGNWVR
jgi:hypothetical protein